MKTTNCIIIEDEPIASEILEDYIRQVPYLNLLATHQNALDALEDIKEKQVDLLFLDIHLPVIKGLQFLRTLARPLKVIVTTAYHQYAVESFELEAVDYLLKPFSFDRFLMAVNKLERKQQPEPQVEAPPGHIFVNIAKRRVRVRFMDILYIEGAKEYVKIFTKDQVLKTKIGLNQIETMLPQTMFVRSHRSFIVAKDQVVSFDHSFLEIGEQFIPIGKNYKSHFLSVME